MSPKLAIVGVAIGTDSDERTGIEAGRGIGAGGGEELEPARRGGVDGGQLPPGEAVVEAVSGAGGRRPAAWQRRSGVQSGHGGPGAHARIGVGAAEVQRRGRRAVWADAGGGASGEGRRADGRSRNAAAVAAGRGPVEPAAEAVALSPAAGAEGALR